MYKTMKIKKLLTFIVLIICSVTCYSQDFNQKYLIDKSFFFYVPNQDEINDYFSFYSFLNKIETNEVFVNKDKIQELYEKFINKKTLHSLLFESYLRVTNNKNLQKIIIELKKEGILKDEYSDILIRKYNSEKNVKKSSDRETVQYNYNNQYFDENINLFSMHQITTFDKKLGMMLYNNDWVNISFNDPNKKENEDSFFLNYGGGTNSMNISLKEYINIDNDELINKVVGNKFNNNKYENWEIFELNPEGILARSAADKIFIGYGAGSDVIPEIKNASFQIILYNSNLKIAYDVTYFMNFSRINNYYEIRNRIWNELFMHLNFTFLNVKS